MSEDIQKNKQKNNKKQNDNKKKTNTFLGPPDILLCPIVSKIGGGFSCIV